MRRKKKQNDVFESLFDAFDNRFLKGASMVQINRSVYERYKPFIISDKYIREQQQKKDKNNKYFSSWKEWSKWVYLNDKKKK
jgi:hypothetical protein